MRFSISSLMPPFSFVYLEHPEPGYLSVTGCSVVTYCVLETVQDGSLTCTVKGILPQVQLEWRTFYHGDADLISFTNQQLIVKDNGQSVDVVLTSTYRITDNGPSRLTIECRVSEPDSIFGYLSTKLDLLLIDGKHGKRCLFYIAEQVADITNIV